MNKFKAFTLIEVMISIFVFSSAMLGFMAFHAHTMSVVFDNESAQFAYALAFNLIDEINAAPNDLFTKLKGFNTPEPDKTLSATNLFGEDFKASPFNSFGQQTKSTENYRFYRKFKVQPYSTTTGVNVHAGTHLSTLYEVEVTVKWPKRNDPTANCDSESASCDVISVILVRSNK